MADNMGNNTITSANSVFYLTVPGLYDTPVKIERYGTDASVAPEQINPVVAEKGVDGHTSFGWVPTNKVLTVTIAADSPSRAVFDDWLAYQDSVREVVFPPWHGCRNQQARGQGKEQVHAEDLQHAAV